VGSGRAVEVDTTSPPLPPFFPVEVGRGVDETTGLTLLVEAGRGVDETTGLTLLVETGRATMGEVFGPFPPFPPLPVDEGTAGEVEGRFGDETVELRTLEEETFERVAVGLTAEVDGMSLEAGVPSSVTVK
jgi:hypothetical protein